MTLEEKKARLAELKAKLAQMKQSASIDAERGGLQAAAERLMVDDPIAAFGLLDKSRALDIKEQQASRERGLGSSEEIRRQLRMNAERAAENSRNPDLDKSVRARYLEEEAVYLAESEKDSPSLQAAAIAVGEIRRGKKAPGAEKVVGGDGGDAGAVTYASALAKLKENMGKLRYADEATGIKPAFLEEIANLAEGDQQTLKGLFDAEAAKLPKRPGAININTKVDDLVNGNSTEAVPMARAQYAKALGTFESGVSLLGTPEGVGSAIGNFLYSLRPEAVNEGDIELAKSAVRDKNQQTLKTLLDKVGMGGTLTTDYKSLARSLGEAARDKLIKSRNSGIGQIKEILSDLDQAKVGKRAGVYFREPSTLPPVNNKNMNDGSSLLRTGTADELDKALNL